MCGLELVYIYIYICIEHYPCIFSKYIIKYIKYVRKSIKKDIKKLIVNNNKFKDNISDIYNVINSESVRSDGSG